MRVYPSPGSWRRGSRSSQECREIGEVGPYWVVNRRDLTVQQELEGIAVMVGAVMVWVMGDCCRELDASSSMNEWKMGG
ncbi:hypothetical protein C1H46_017854 [Malus baccata]|uniref:Uncharacterized protein n=1 Tax=Malus baccata TaxID=106549 RepID=A0A540MCP1_MALBA|nr:hypothetical protein C1H46_030389 [Malus baccata]TQD96516.1 hypothetical protein C1H46_017854 [Malus baccata]